MANIRTYLAEVGDKFRLAATARILNRSNARRTFTNGITKSVLQHYNI